MASSLTDKQKELLTTVAPLLESGKIGADWLVIYERDRFDHIKEFGDLNAVWRNLGAERIDLDNLANCGFLSHSKGNRYSANIGAISTAVRRHFRPKRTIPWKFIIGVILVPIIAAIIGTYSNILSPFIPFSKPVPTPQPSATSTIPPSPTPLGWYDGFDGTSSKPDTALWELPSDPECTVQQANGRLTVTNVDDQSWHECAIRLRNPSTTIPFSRLGSVSADIRVEQDPTRSQPEERGVDFTFYLAFDIEKSSFVRCGFGLPIDVEIPRLGHYFSFFHIGQRDENGGSINLVNMWQVSSETIDFSPTKTHHVELAADSAGQKPFRCLIDGAPIEYDTSRLDASANQQMVDKHIADLRAKNFIRQLVLHAPPNSTATISFDNVTSQLNLAGN